MQTSVRDLRRSQFKIVIGARGRAHPARQTCSGDRSRSEDLIERAGPPFPAALRSRGPILPGLLQPAERPGQVHVKSARGRDAIPRPSTVSTTWRFDSGERSDDTSIVSGSADEVASTLVAWSGWDSTGSTSSQLARMRGSRASASPEKSFPRSRLLCERSARETRHSHRSSASARKDRTTTPRRVDGSRHWGAHERERHRVGFRPSTSQVIGRAARGG
jgi:hypothetical protein